MAFSKLCCRTNIFLNDDKRTKQNGIGQPKKIRDRVYLYVKVFNIEKGNGNGRQYIRYFI